MMNLVGYPYQSHFLEVDTGVFLHYLDEGKSDGPVLVMVHGNPTWSYFYRHLIELFKNTHRLIVVDHVGCGLSSKPQDYDYRLSCHGDNLVKLLRFLSLRSFSLVVHDWGGAIGILGSGRYQQQRPDVKLERVVFLNTAAFISPSIPWRINFLRDKPWSRYLIKRLNLFAWPATWMSTVKKLPAAVRQSYLAPYQGPDDREAIYRFVQDIPMDSTHPSYSTLREVEEYLKRLGVPVLLFWGMQDFCFHSGFLQEFEKRLPQSITHRLHHAGHYVLEEMKPQDQKVLIEFLK